MIRLDAATVLLQWATGGMFFCWFTTRHRVLGLGYGWMLRGTFALMAGGAFGACLVLDPVPVRTVAAAGVVLACTWALIDSVRRKAAGVAGHDEDHDRRSARVAAMTGIDRTAPRHGDGGPGGGTDGVGRRRLGEYDPRFDLLPVVIGFVGLVAAGLDAGGNGALAVARTLIGAAFLGAVTDAMLLGHWYLVQPGLARKYLIELVVTLGWLWPLEVGAMLWPTGMVSVLNGTIDDGWGGILGWTWLLCAVTTIGLVIVTRLALKERWYSAVMAATGLLYLAILTAFGTDLVARATLAG